MANFNVFSSDNINTSLFLEANVFFSTSISIFLFFNASYGAGTF